MTRSRITLLIPGATTGHSAWRVGRLTPDGPVVERLPIADGLDSSGSIKALVDQLRDKGYRGEPVVLGLPTSMCLFARLPYPTGGGSKPRRRSRGAWTYKLEERLPVAAEQVVADFIWQRDAALGVAVLSDTLRPMAEALASAGVRLRAIVPLSLLATAHRTQTLREQGIDAAVWVSGEGLEVAHLSGGDLVNWLLRDNEPGAATRQLRRLTSDREETLRVASFGTTGLDVEDGEPIDVIEQQDTTLEEDATHYGDRIARGAARPPVDLLNNGLSPTMVPREVRRSLAGAVVAGLLLIVTLTGVMHWRAMQYQAEASASRAAEARLYREAFPGKPLPANVRSRLVSEHRKLQTLGSASRDDPSESSALRVLYDTLACLPTDAPFSIEQMRIGERDLQVEGMTKTHGDADALAAAVRQAIGWRVETPRTEQRRDGTVGFTIRAVADQPTRVASSRSSGGFGSSAGSGGDR